MAEMQAEKDQLEAERAENQRMMQELLALKAQLEQKNGEVTPPVAPASEVIPEEAATEETVTGATETEADAPTEVTDEN